MAYEIGPDGIEEEPSSQRNANVKRMAAHEARQLAEWLLREKKVSGLMQRVIATLSTEGILPEASVRRWTKVSQRSLQRYRRRALLDLVNTPRRLSRLLGSTDLRLWALGPLGMALAELQHGLVPTGYLTAKQDRVTHDVLCNLVCQQITHAATGQGYRVSRHSKYEATVHGDEGQPLLEPDAMLSLTGPDGVRQVYLVEYHNEDFGTRAEEKIDKYEYLLSLKDERRWRKAWQMATGMPIILVAWTHEAVGDAYERCIQARIAENKRPWTYYLGKPLNDFLKGETPLTWRTFNYGQSANLLTLRHPSTK